MLHFYNECKNCGWYEESEKITLDHEPEFAIMEECPECGSKEIESDEYDDGEIDEYTGENRSCFYDEDDYRDNIGYGPDYGSPSY